MSFPPPPPPLGGGGADHVPPVAPPPPAAPPAAPAAPAAAAPPPPTANITGNGRVQEVRAQVESVRQVMAANVNAVLERGERLDVLEGKTEDLSSTAAAFTAQGRALRRRMWLNNVKTKLFAGLAIGLVLVVIFSVACFMGGRNCLGGGSDAVVTPAPGAAAADAQPLLGAGDSLGGGVVPAPTAVTTLPDGSAVIRTPLPSQAPQAADAPGVLTTEEAASVLSSGVGRRRRFVL